MSFNPYDASNGGYKLLKKLIPVIVARPKNGPYAGATIKKIYL